MKLWKSFLKRTWRLKRKIEKQIEEKNLQKLINYPLRNDQKDHEKHRRQDGRKVFRGVVDYQNV